MKITIDTEQNSLVSQNGAGREEMPLYSAKAFEILSREWVKVGWDLKYSYSFSWLGRPIIQLPEDMVRIQEVIYTLKPDVIVETGIAHGGSLIYYATLCKVMDKGRVIGIDREIRPHNRAALEAHPLINLITLVEGSSTDPAIVTQVRELVGAAKTVLVILDSCHTKDHVRAELSAYASMVTPGSYIVATDGIMAEVASVPRAHPDWTWNNPISAVHEFLETNQHFRLTVPAFPFNEGTIQNPITHWPCAYLRRAA